MQARRSYEKPEEVSVFATIANYNIEKVSCDVQLSINDDVKAVRNITIPGAQFDTEDPEPGKVSVDFSLAEPGAGIVEVMHLYGDSLASDNAAWSILPPPKKLTVLLVTEGNVVLESALKACPLARLETVSPADFNEMDLASFISEEPWDVIVLDKHDGSKLPRGRYLIFGQPPEGIDVTISGKIENQFIVDWRPRHSVLQYVNLMNLFASKCYKMSLPRDAEILAEFNGAPALGLVRRKGSVFLLAGFDILESNWPFEPGFILFCYNATAFLGMQAGQNQEANLQIGEAIIVEGLEPDTVGQISGPYFKDREIKANPSGSLRFPNIERAGIYTLNVTDQQPRLFSASLLNQDESDIAPETQLLLQGEVVESEANVIGKTNQPLWPYLAGLALVLACLEWLIYNLKIRI